MGGVAEVAPNAEGGKTELTSATCGSNGALGEDSAVVRKEEGEVLENTAVKGACVKVLPGTAVDSERSHGQGTLENTQNLDADHLNPDTRLSASATPDKAREIDAVALRISVLHRHLQQDGADERQDLAAQILSCRCVEDVSRALLLTVKPAFDSNPAFSLWSNQDRTDWEARCGDCTSVEVLADLLTELEQMTGVGSPDCDEAMEISDAAGGIEGSDPMQPDFVVDEIPEEPALEEEAPASTSRFGRRRAVPNFARMVDPLAQRANEQAPAPRAPPSNGGADDVQATATQNMIELVKVIVSKAPKGTTAGPVPGQPASTGQDKFVGVRIKQNGYGAVIKKNHSEINLGTFSTPEEAARAYDMAALICQGDRAKVNFVDSWDIVQQYDTSAIREPFRDNHNDSRRDHSVQAHVPRRPQTVGDIAPAVEWTPQTYETADTSTPASLGRLLNDFADRFPYAAVRDLDPAVWEVFMSTNSTLSDFQEFGCQLLWLSAQVADAAMMDSWGLHQGRFEQECRECDQGDKCIELLKLFDHHGVDWSKVSALWDIDDDAPDAQGKRGSGMKRKRVDEGGDRVRIEDFLQLNWHVLTDFERDSTTSLQTGIEPTLYLMRSRAQAARQSAQPRMMPSPLQPLKTEVARRPVVSAARPAVDRKMSKDKIRDQPDHVAGAMSGKLKDMTCRFCGKIFTHAPAHLQHERAHLQQQETKNPSSRIFQHMPPPVSGTSPCAPGSDGEASGALIRKGTVATLSDTPASHVLDMNLEDDSLVDEPHMDGSLDESETRWPPHDEHDGHVGENGNIDDGVHEDDDDEEESNLAMAALPGDSTCGSRASIEEGVPCLPSGEVLSGPVSPSAEYECTL